MKSAVQAGADSVMGTSTDLRRELKRVFFPLLRERGFVQDDTNAPNDTSFRRQLGDVVHILEVQWEKYGDPTFVINFGTCPATGLDTPRGHFPADSVYAGWLPENGRLQPRRGHSVRNWFSQRKPWLTRIFAREKLRSAQEVVGELLGIFPEVETYWASGTIGKHLMIYRRA